jgi:hypothetical protein
MEPITAVAIVNALVWTFTETSAGKVVEQAALGLWEKCKNLLKGEEITTIFPDTYDSQKQQKKLEEKIEEKIASDPLARKELEEAFNQLPPQVKNNAMNIGGNVENAIQFDTIQGVNTGGGDFSLVKKSG